MNLAEVQVLLVYISQTDNRDTTNPLATRAWHDALEPFVNPADAKAAVIAHRRNRPGVYLEAGHVNEFCRQLRRQRMASSTVVPEIPDGLTQAQERRWTLAFWDAVKEGAAQPQERADAALGLPGRPELPSPDPQRLQRALSASPMRGLGR